MQVAAFFVSFVLIAGTVLINIVVAILLDEFIAAVEARLAPAPASAPPQTPPPTPQEPESDTHPFLLRERIRSGHAYDLGASWAS